MSNNPYAKATGAYDLNAKDSASDPRELEARVLLQSARQLQELRDNWDSVTLERLEEALTYNKRLWMIFVDTAITGEGENHTVELRSNIANLGSFIFKRTLEIQAELDQQKARDKLEILVEINRDIAAGLMAGAKAAKPASVPTKENTTESHATTA